MAIVQFNPLFQSLRGRVGNVIYRQRNGRTFMHVAPPKPKPQDWSPEQQAHRARFAQAAAYARSVCADPARRAAYEAVKKPGDPSVYSTALRDWLRPPTVAEIDLASYHGKRGGSIAIKADDDTSIAQVRVVIRDAAGRIIEEGAAERVMVDWQYRAQRGLGARRRCSVEVTAIDLAGHGGVRTEAFHK
jgi:hypothetical protein